ncbi:MAG: hypothetical protein ACI9FJ_001599, partial [Alteromonadaceae bacterium]
PTVCELEGPMPILKISKVLIIVLFYSLLRRNHKGILSHSATDVCYLDKRTVVNLSGQTCG